MHGGDGRPRPASPATKSRSATAVQRVGRRPVEAQRLRPVACRRSMGKDVPARAAAPSGHSLSRRPCIDEPAAIARQHLHVGQQMVAEGHGLGGLQMGEAGHDRRGAVQGLLRQHGHQRGELPVELVRWCRAPRGEIRGDLVVARAGGVQAAGRRAGERGKPRFDIHVNVLERPRKSERALLDFAADSL